MDTLHRDWNPYLVELGVAVKRGAERCLDDVRYATRGACQPSDEPRPPAVLPYAAVTDSTSQYQAIRSIVSMLELLSYTTAKAVPDDASPYLVSIDWLPCQERAAWWATYACQIEYVRWHIDQYMGSSGLDETGKRVRFAFGAMLGTILELVPAHGAVPDSRSLKLMRQAVADLASQCSRLPQC